MHRTRRGRPSATRLALVAVAVVAWLAGPRDAAADRTDRSAVVEGLHENTPAVHALTNARIVVSPGNVIAKGAVVLRDGVVAAVGADVVPPPDARVWDLTGRTIYPGLIDAYSEPADGAPPPPATPAGGTNAVGEELLRPAPTPAAGGAAYWNPRVTPQFNAAEAYMIDTEANKKLRGQGVVARLVAPGRQIVKGTSAAVSTADGDATRLVLRPAVAMHVRLTPTNRGDDRVYPNSPMGAYALVRQAILDARWYAAAHAAWAADRSLPRPEQNDALAALGPAAAGKLPLFVDAPDELYALRADRLGKEFGLPVVVRGSGQEFRRLSLIAEAKRPVVVPVNFPPAPNVASPEGALAVSLDELMDWDLEPENPARLARANVRIALTAHGLKDKATFLAAVRKAVKRGLPADAALAALTTVPAELLGLDKTHGAIEKGRSASLVVADGDLFTGDKTQVLETWVDGRRYEIVPTLSPDPRGTWAIAWTAGGSAKEVSVRVTGTPAKLAGKILMSPPATRPAGEARAVAEPKPATGPASRPADLDLANVASSPGQISFTFKADRLGTAGVAVASAAVIDDAWTGQLLLPDGQAVSIRGKRTAKPTADDAAGDGDKDKPDDKDAKDGDGPPTTGPAVARRGGEGGGAGASPRNDPTTRPALFDVNYPLGPFGRADVPPRPRHVYFTNATVWTSGPDGKLAKGSVLVADGKIAGVFRDTDLPGIPDDAVRVDCAGKHLTPGIIDCHSHIATDGGVNESGRAVTCQVRIGDFVDPDDISIYRQLAGGVTAANVLHGSANPIGGQNQVVKLRWGAGPEELKLDGAPPGVKFALGENVKQSNWGERMTTRYPQTRLGVEQVFRDSFAAARDYRAAHDRFKANGAGPPPRVDLEMEALWEIVSGARLIHCHSYRQDEILALLRACEQFNVKVATLQHILEGYKVADAIKRHGAGASSFSDWWAYKFEVFDAIPYNGAVLRDAGVLVSFNSDDAELARRLNTEAAKAVKYGKVPEEEALRFVTLNPAKQLRVDGRIGSIEVGKDADLVVWSGPPLSTLSRCEQTWVDGRRYFDRDEDAAMRRRDADRRAKLVQKVLSAGGGSGGTQASTEPREPRERERWAREDRYCGCQVQGGK